MCSILAMPPRCLETISHNTPLHRLLRSIIDHIKAEALRRQALQTQHVQQLQAQLADLGQDAGRSVHTNGKPRRGDRSSGARLRQSPSGKAVDRSPASGGSGRRRRGGGGQQRAPWNSITTRKAPDPRVEAARVANMIHGRGDTSPGGLPAAAGSNTTPRKRIPPQGRSKSAGRAVGNNSSGGSGYLASQQYYHVTHRPLTQEARLMNRLLRRRGGAGAGSSGSGGSGHRTSPQQQYSSEPGDYQQAAPVDGLALSAPPLGRARPVPSPEAASPTQTPPQATTQTPSPPAPEQAQWSPSAAEGLGLGPAAAAAVAALYGSQAPAGGEGGKANKWSRLAQPAARGQDSSRRRKARRARIHVRCTMVCFGWCAAHSLGRLLAPGTHGKPIITKLATPSSSRCSTTPTPSTRCGSRCASQRCRKQ